VNGASKVTLPYLGIDAGKFRPSGPKKDRVSLRRDKPRKLNAERTRDVKWIGFAVGSKTFYIA
jgi:hypothetical protein